MLAGCKVRLSGDLLFFKKNFHKQKNSLHLQPQRDGIIAQLVEQRTENPCVAGSIPADTTTVKSLFFYGNRLFLCFKCIFLAFSSICFVSGDLAI
jgi:hypothetical protein